MQDEQKKVSAGFVVTLIIGSLMALFLLVPSGGNRKRINDIMETRVTMKNVAVAIDNYRPTFGSVPERDNRSITAALRGENPSKINLLAAWSPSKLNSNHELVDSWQTPFQIRIITNTVHLRSAGPNKNFGDADDLILEESLK